MQDVGRMKRFESAKRLSDKVRVLAAVQNSGYFRNNKTTRQTREATAKRIDELIGERT